jgi:hypothetical protein
MRLLELVMAYTDEEDGMGFSGLVPSREEVKRNRAVAEPLVDRNRLIDNLVNVIDEGIRKSKYSTYDEWQDAISAVLSRCTVKEKTIDLSLDANQSDAKIRA